MSLKQAGISGGGWEGSIDGNADWSSSAIPGSGDGICAVIPEDSTSSLWSFPINALTGVPSTVPSTVQFPEPCLKPLRLPLNSAPNPDASAEFG